MTLHDYTNYASDYIWQIGTISAILLYLVYWHQRPKRLPPGPRGLPIVGYLPFLGERPEKVVYNLTKKYGKILTVRMGTEDTVILNDYESIHKVSKVRKQEIIHINDFSLLPTLIM